MGWVRDSPSLFQAMSSPPLSPLAMNFPSFDTATLRTLKRCPFIVFNATPFSKSHRRSILSHEAVTIRHMSIPSFNSTTYSTYSILDARSENRYHSCGFTFTVCPVHFAITLPVSMSHSLTPPSELPLTAFFPSGDNAIVHTPLPPVRQSFPICFPLFKFHIGSEPSDEQVIIRCPSSGVIAEPSCVLTMGGDNDGWRHDSQFSTTEHAERLGQVGVEYTGSSRCYPTDNCYALYGIGSPVFPQDVFQNFLNRTSSINIIAPYLNPTSYAQASGLPMIMMETNSASCGGLPGISDTFGATLWALDYGLQMAYSNFSGAMMHVGGQDVYYNPFTPPPLQANTDNMFTPAYAIYENGAPVREVQHYVGRPDLWRNLPSSNTCQVTVPAPGAALVFLSSNAYAESGNPSTQTFSTTAVTKTVNTARIDPSVLATSNGMSGATWELGSTSKGNTGASLRNSLSVVSIVGQPLKHTVRVCCITISPNGEQLTKNTLSAAFGMDYLYFARHSKVKLGLKLYAEALSDAEKVIELNPSSYLGYELKHAALHGAHRHYDAFEALTIMLSKLNDTLD
ncbi:hypothetical protein DFJ58DRAFT_728345 [Suillus subalutaceus]|uniref:uncharacterized protein n=2 Tax=Suillus subalutaceus TaxID=48586 RepID=UPI001B876A63|nr:uncharacterized protein DFJ58DRAFT_728345 [Suillus subalutaceus]KAG1852844.1 hypothetical protein DFJ58DRAFT_728345 [Suillus subalutaceus]